MRGRREAGRWWARALPPIVAGLTILGASLARAQEPTGSWQPPPITLAPHLALAVPWLVPGEPTGAAGAAGPSSWVLATPLRLSLLAGIEPMARGFANCVGREEPSGNTIHGFAVQRSASVALTPSLVLQGFSSAGCPVDAGIGGGVTYTEPLRPSLWMVASAGVYAVPPHAPIPARVQTDARIDLTHPLDAGPTVSVGVGKRGITIGGAAW